MKDLCTEHQHQVTVFQWAKIKESEYPCLSLLYAIPNAGKYKDTGRLYMWAEGLRSGVPDICLPVPNHSFAALYIELKKKGGKVSDAQFSWINALTSVGNKVAVCYGADEAIKVIEEYLK